MHIYGSSNGNVWCQTIIRTNTDVFALDPQKQTSVKFEWKYKLVPSGKCNWKDHLQEGLKATFVPNEVKPDWALPETTGLSELKYIHMIHAWP